jgi:hypothetical protein
MISNEDNDKIHKIITEQYDKFNEVSMVNQELWEILYTLFNNAVRKTVSGYIPKLFDTSEHPEVLNALRNAVLQSHDYRGLLNDGKH